MDIEIRIEEVNAPAKLNLSVNFFGPRSLQRNCRERQAEGEEVCVSKTTRDSLKTLFYLDLRGHRKFTNV